MHGAQDDGSGGFCTTAASTGEDMSMGASQVTENVSPQVVMVTGKPVCAQASAYDPEGFFAALSSPR